MTEKRKEEIKLTFTQAGKKIGAASIILAIVSGLGAYSNSIFSGYKKDSKGALSRSNDKRISILESKSKDSEKGMVRVYRKLDGIDRDIKTILILIKR